MAEADALYAQLYSAHSEHLVTLAELLAPAVHFYSAKLDGQLVGCGALVQNGWEGEIKRIYVRPAGRGHGVASTILATLEQRARELNIRVIRLETGIHQDAAIALYEAKGYRRAGAFAPYQPHPESLFFEKVLSADDQPGL
jgi:putative acetyltransferase